MSDGASCACLRVKYKTFPSVNHPGALWGHWVCDLCGALFLPKRLAEYQTREAVQKVRDEVCVKKQEAEPMSGELTGAALEQALKEDAKDRDIARHKLVEPEAKPFSGDLPDGMRTVLWVPLEGGMFQCSIEGFGFKAVSTSRNKQRALAYALEDIARQMLAQASADVAKEASRG